MSDRSIVRLFLLEIALFSASINHVITAQQTTTEGEVGQPALRFHLLSNDEDLVSIGPRVRRSSVYQITSSDELSGLAKRE